MRNHSELEKVDTLATLNLVVELNSDEGTFRRRQTSPWLLFIRKEKDEVVRCFWPAVLQGTLLCLHHQDDKQQVSNHADNIQRNHHCWIADLADQDNEANGLDKKVETPKKLVGIASLRKTSLVLEDHQVAAEQPRKSL